MKRFRVSPPKTGHLYPDLTNIESSSTEETESEYTTESTAEAETATDTATETATEAEYHIQVGL